MKIEAKVYAQWQDAQGRPVDVDLPFDEARAGRGVYFALRDHSDATYVELSIDVSTEIGAASDRWVTAEVHGSRRDLSILPGHEPKDLYEEDEGAGAMGEL